MKHQIMILKFYLIVLKFFNKRNFIFQLRLKNTYEDVKFVLLQFDVIKASPTIEILDTVENRELLSHEFNALQINSDVFLAN